MKTTIGRKLSVFLDIDETLVHYSRINPEVKFVRPGAKEFIQKISELEDAEINIFTAATMEHVIDVEDLLGFTFPRDNILCRDQCSIYKGFYVKDLGLTGKDINKSILIDDSPTSGLLQPSNLLLVPRYLGPERPCEILNINPNIEKQYCFDCIKNPRQKNHNCKYLDSLFEALKVERGKSTIDDISEIKKRYRGKCSDF